MSSRLLRLLHRKFSSLMGLQVPGFYLVDNPWKDSQLYQCDQSPDFALFLFLTIDGTADKFNIEVAWSAMRRFPFHLVGLTPKDAPVDREMRFRISFLWKPNALQDDWWELRPLPTMKLLRKSLSTKQLIKKESDKVAESRIDGLVSDSISRIVEFAIPYFDAILRYNVDDCHTTRPIR